MKLPAVSETKTKLLAISTVLLVCIYVRFHIQTMREYKLNIRQFQNYSKIKVPMSLRAAENISGHENRIEDERKEDEDLGQQKRSEINQTNHLMDLKPVCENLLQNMTKGHWVKRVYLPKYRQQISQWKNTEVDLEHELRKFWVKRGIQTAFWRSDNRCGYENSELRPPNSTWPLVGSWCDARGEKPCCSDVANGFCMKHSEKSCRCAGCVDLRRYIYADVSDWVVEDTNCHWRNYTASEACDVIEKSPFEECHFVGDSFMRNMFRTFSMLITGDTVHGAMNKSTPMELRKLCTERQQFFWKECRETIYNMSETLYKHNLCGGRGIANFTAISEPFFSKRFSKHFLDLIKSKLGKPGTLIIISIGFHMGCKAINVISNFLGPAVKAIEDYYGGLPGEIHPHKLSGRWPQLMLSLPLRIGLLKPPTFLVRQNDTKCDKYSSDMMEYAEKHDIRVLDFRPLTTLVHSFDGTHHGIGVNMMKNQILLNFISSLDS